MPNDTNPHDLPGRSFDEERRRLGAWIETAARKAKEDSVFATRYGIVPVRDMSLFADPTGHPTPTEWLNGALQALLPRGWRYAISRRFDGTPRLTLTSFERDPPAAR